VFRFIASILVVACVAIAWYLSDTGADKLDNFETVDNASKPVQAPANAAPVASPPADKASRPANNKSFNFGN
jgi:hypothetical protein